MLFRDVPNCCLQWFRPLTARLALLVCAAGPLAAWADPTPDRMTVYSYGCLPNMPVVSAATKLSVLEGNSITQTFIPRPDAFLAAFNRQDSNGVRVANVANIILKCSAWQSSASTFNVALSRVESGGARTLLYRQDFAQKVQGETAYTFSFSNAVPVDLDQPHELTVRLVTCGANMYGGPPAVGLYTPAGDYPEGASSAGSDIWFSLAGSSSVPVFTNLNVTAIATNAYFLDTSTNQDSSSYDYLRGKFLGVNGQPEQLKFTCPAAWAPTFILDNTNAATLAVAGGGGTNTVTLNGLAEAETFLLVKSGASVVGWLKLQSHPRRTIKLAYAYIRYPTESSNALYSFYPGISNYISGVYSKVNVGIVWTNDGVLTCNWDLNGDGSSWDPNYDEQWLPMTSGLLPNQEKVFANLFALRDLTNNNQYMSPSGGGTSMGFGSDSTPPRGAMKRANLQSSTAASIGSTLAHELGHNLGLYHVAVGTPATDNLMDVGRYADTLYSWQWALVHQTLGTLFDVPPAVALTSPGNGTYRLQGSTVNLAAGILTNRNPIARVEFFANGTNLLGADTNAPFTFAWTNLPAGNYNLTAVVYDNQWLTATSAVVTLLVTNPLPVVTLTSPTNGFSGLAPAAINLTAAVTTNGNSLTKVQFLAGASVIGEALTAPFSCAWTNVASGNYVLKARLIYNGATVLDSAGVNISVLAPPRVPPALAGLPVSGGFTLGGSGPVGQTYILQTVSDLTPPLAWVSIATNVAGADGRFSFTDDQSTNFVQRYYRTLTP